MKRKFIIYAALYEESKEGWVWIPPTNEINSEFIRIINPKTEKYIVCERRTLDDNYVKYYNNRHGARKINKEDIERCIVINEYYRNKLGNISTKEEVELEIVETNKIRGYLQGALHHPNQYLRYGIMSNILALIFGMLSLILGVLPVLT